LINNENLIINNNNKLSGRSLMAMFVCLFVYLFGVAPAQPWTSTMSSRVASVPMGIYMCSCGNNYLTGQMGILSEGNHRATSHTSQGL
jgi:hypothetical protein